MVFIGEEMNIQRKHLKKLKEFILDVGQMTLRQQSIKEIKRAVELSTLPDGI